MVADWRMASQNESVEGSGEFGLQLEIGDHGGRVVRTAPHLEGGLEMP